MELLSRHACVKNVDAGMENPGNSGSSSSWSPFSSRTPDAACTAIEPFIENPDGEAAVFQVGLDLPSDAADGVGGRDNFDRNLGRSVDQAAFFGEAFTAENSHIRSEYILLRYHEASLDQGCQGLPRVGVQISNRKIRPIQFLVTSCRFEARGI